VSDLLTTLSSTLIDQAWDRMRHPAAWPDIGSGFASFLLTKATLPLPDAFVAPFRTVNAWDFRRAPELAGFGYVLATERGRDPTLQLSWAQGLARLALRDAFPSDRQSFVHDPVELVGIALGAASCCAVTADQRRWLSETVRRAVIERRLAGPVADLAALCAAHALATETPEPSQLVTRRFPPLRDLEIDELCLSAALATAFPELAAAQDLAPWRDPAGMEREIVGRALRQPIPSRGVEPAALYVCLRRAVDRIIIHPGLDTDATALVVTLCRRFQLFVDRLQTRQRGRPALIIKDEYDVQDLLHAILRLHFDDVRPEEWTPSYAGKTSRIDFYLPRERTIVEAKMTRAKLGQKEVGDQLIIDKERYRNFPGADTLVCFVYDPQRRCPNPAALEADLAEAAPLRVSVVVCPQGL